jgi:hypothetical protein
MLLACGGTTESSPVPTGTPADGGGAPEGGQPEASPPDGGPSSLAIADPSFSLPADGAPNNNGYIGPFCCTGVTATVRGTDGTPLGYAYFFGFTNAFNENTTSYAEGLSILISGVPSLDDPSAPQTTGEIDFASEEMKVGLSRSSQVGALLYKVTISHVDITSYDGQPYYDMGTIAVRVDVSVAP